MRHTSAQMPWEGGAATGRRIHLGRCALPRGLVAPIAASPRGAASGGPRGPPRPFRPGQLLDAIRDRLHSGGEAARAS